MMHPRRSFLTGLVLTLLLGVALVASAFAHRMPQVQDVGLQSYLLAGGDLADLCNHADREPAASGDCAACRLVGCVVLPDPRPDFVAVERTFAVTVLIPARKVARRSPRDPALGNRAPPLA